MKLINRRSLPFSFAINEKRLCSGLIRLLFDSAVLLEDLGENQRMVSVAFANLKKMAAMRDFALLAAMAEYEICKTAISRLKEQDLHPNIAYLQKNYDIFNQPIAKIAKPKIDQSIKLAKAKSGCGLLSFALWPAGQIFEQHTHFTFNINTDIDDIFIPEVLPTLDYGLRHSQFMGINLTSLYLCFSEEMKVIEPIIMRHTAFASIKGGRALKCLKDSLDKRVMAVNYAIDNSLERIDYFNLLTRHNLSLANFDLSSFISKCLQSLATPVSNDVELVRSAALSNLAIADFEDFTGLNVGQISSRFFEDFDYLSVNASDYQNYCTLINRWFDVVDVNHIEKIGYCLGYFSHAPTNEMIQLAEKINLGIFDENVRMISQIFLTLNGKSVPNDLKIKSSDLLRYHLEKMSINKNEFDSIEMAFNAFA